MKYLSVSAALIVLAVTVAALVSLPPAENDLLIMGNDLRLYATATTTRPFPDAIVNSATAVALSNSAFPPGYEPYSQTVRLVAFATLEAWVDIEDEFHSDGLPVWVVGMLADNLTRGAFFGVTDPEQVAGGWYGWDATNGWEVVAGVLYGSRHSSGVTWASLAALPPADIPVYTATPLPEFITGLEELTPPYSVSELPTVHALLTAIAAHTPTPTPTAPLP